MPPRLNNPDFHQAKCIYEFAALNVKEEVVKLDIYKGFLCIVVNVATKSPFTDSHYKQFNELMKKFGEKGLRILAFPCNQFGQEEPGTNQEIAAHAEAHNVAFDVFAKVEVNGPNAHPLFKFIKNRLSPQSRKFLDVIKWSYTKYIISKTGIPVERYGPELEPNQFDEQNLLGPYWNIEEED